MQPDICRNLSTTDCEALLGFQLEGELHFADRLRGQRHQAAKFPFCKLFPSIHFPSQSVFEVCSFITSRLWTAKGNSAENIPICWRPHVANLRDFWNKGFTLSVT